MTRAGSCEAPKKGKARRSGPFDTAKRGSVLRFGSGFGVGLGLFLLHAVGNVLRAIGNRAGGIGLAFLVRFLDRVCSGINGGCSGAGSSGGGGTGGALANGVAKPIPGAAGSSQVWTLAVPAGATGLKFVSAGGSGDADMYVKFGSAPTTVLKTRLL